MALLAEVVGLVGAAGYRIGSIDATVVAERIRIAPHREEIRSRLAGVLGLEIATVSVKATTTDGLGLIIGRDEGIAALAVAVVLPAEH
jgi:2-C-methyl-D-erythritol 2,4-cyclodiphosphate synthase